MKKNRLIAISIALVLGLGGCAVKPEASKLLQLSISSRGVTYTIAVNGVASPLLSSDSLIGSTMSGPLDVLGVKTQPGTNVIEVTILDTDVERSPYFHLDLQEFEPGDVVDTTQPTSPNVLVTTDLVEGQLLPGLTAKYEFQLPQK